MKKLIVFLLSLTFLSAQAQYHKGRASQAYQQSSSLSYYQNSKIDISPKTNPEIHVPLFLTTSGTSTSHTAYTTYNNNPFAAAEGQSYWSGTKMTTSSTNGRFQAVQTFDISGNLKESKATFQFPKKKH
jgi:hypothetical protein